MKTDEGQHVTLTCKANFDVFSAQPVWRFRGHDVPSTTKHARVHVENKLTSSYYISVLHIKSTNISDTGGYTCEAVKRKDGRKSFKSSHLHVLSECLWSYNVLHNRVLKWRHHFANLSIRTFKPLHAVYTAAVRTCANFQIASINIMKREKFEVLPTLVTKSMTYRAFYYKFKCL